MIAKKKVARTGTKRHKVAKKGANAPTTLTPEAQQLTNGKFVLDTFRSVEGSLARIADPESRKPFAARFKAMKAKFKDLPKTKVTNERAERYVAEIQKIAVEIQAAARD